MTGRAGRPGVTVAARAAGFTPVGVMGVAPDAGRQPQRSALWLPVGGDPTTVRFDRTVADSSIVALSTTRGGKLSLAHDPASAGLAFEPVQPSVPRGRR